MKNLWVCVVLIIASIAGANAQNYAYNNDRYYYDNDFDWHWDIRVRISNGIQQGLITPSESNRLYRWLEDIERKEYAYQADGVFSDWEQQAIWNDVVSLHRQVGIELYDNDRRFYGYNAYGSSSQGYNRWFYKGGYDFFRFDKRGFGSIQFGYAPRSGYNGWYNNSNNYIAREYRQERYHNESYARGGGEHYEYGNRDNSYPNRYKNDSRKYSEHSQVPRGNYEQPANSGYENRENGNQSNNTPPQSPQGSYNGRSYNTPSPRMGNENPNSNHAPRGNEERGGGRRGHGW